jgi:P2 family phage major capsid protein
MQNETRVLFNDFKKDVATLNGISNVAEKFNVAPRVQQTLEKRIQESSDFLKKINVIGVKEQSGEKVGIGTGSTIAGTTDTTVQDREPTDPSSMDKNGYFCTQTNFDTSLRYAKLDAWAGFPEFQTLIRDSIVRQHALDRIMIGFNGITRAATSNRTTNPLLQDVNVGWLEKIRQFAPQNHISEVASGSGVVKIGAGVSGNDGYKNIDAFVLDAVNNLLAAWYQEDTALVAVCGRKMLADKYFPIVNRDQPNSESLAADMIISQKRIGGLPAVRVPFFPANGIMICRLDLLSLYWQKDARRRTIVDNAKRDRIENYESTNDAYVIEDYDGVALLENIELVD